MRIGHGFDVHRFDARIETGTLIRIGGVDVPCDAPVIAHSDGDVAIHALCDALLGAAGLGDIGRHFPDDDPRWADADSRELLRAVVDRVAELGLVPGNADLTIVAQKPRIGPHREAMRRLLAEDLGVDADRVNVKATTTEGLGAIGAGEGLAAHAVVLLVDGRRGAD